MRKAVTFRCRTGHETVSESEISLLELEELLKTLHITVTDSSIQSREKPDPALLIGKGKAEELQKILTEDGADLAVCDNHLSPGQQRNLGKVLCCEVIDRTAVILEIFNRRARSHEGKLQVESAQLKYLLSRLTGKGISMSRQAGGIGTRRGIGETKLELDRRKIRKRIQILEKQLDNLSRNRSIQRKNRSRNSAFSVSLVGYTNAGKSSLFQLLTGNQTYVDNSLFATLDPSVRKVQTPAGFFLLTDTVGFIRNLPTFLVNSFKATLEEIRESDLLLNVVDISDPQHAAHQKATSAILSDLGAMNIPVITVYNKMDLLTDSNSSVLSDDSQTASISCRTGEGIAQLKAKVISFQVNHVRS